MLFTSNLVTQASGSIGGITAARNAAGLYFRARSTPVNPNTPQQQAIRDAMSLLSQRYVDGLTPSQREAWRTYGLNVTSVNRLGQPITLNAMSMYCRCNVSRNQAGLAIIDDAPTTFNLGDTPDVTLDAIGAGSAPEANLIFDAGSNAWAAADENTLLVYASRQRSPSVQFFKGPYRLAKAVSGNATLPVSTADVELPFAGSFGNLITLRFRVSYADGRLSSAQTVTGTVEI